MTLESEMKAQVSLETTIKPHDLVYYLELEPTHHGRNAKIFTIDHHCLLNDIDIFIDLKILKMEVSLERLVVHFYCCWDAAVQPVLAKIPQVSSYDDGATNGNRV